jgi:hypothetical protein
MKTESETQLPHPRRTLFVLFALLLAGCIGAPTAQTTASASRENSKPAQSAVRDGSHDFDFIYGKWRMPNHHLQKRLAGSEEWDDFTTCDEGSPLPGGIGDIDYWRPAFGKISLE